jgi:hypothetical protein
MPFSASGLKLITLSQVRGGYGPARAKLLPRGGETDAA